MPLDALPLDALPLDALPLDALPLVVADAVVCLPSPDVSVVSLAVSALSLVSSEALALFFTLASSFSSTSLPASPLSELSPPLTASVVLSTMSLTISSVTWSAGTFSIWTTKRLPCFSSLV